MPEILDIYDGEIKVINGLIYKEVVFKVARNEGLPEEIIGLCFHDDPQSTLKNLKRIVLGKSDQ